MTYNKPEATKVASSIKAIQGGGKEVPDLLDGPLRLIFTVAAYQADE